MHNPYTLVIGNKSSTIERLKSEYLSEGLYVFYT